LDIRTNIYAVSASTRSDRLLSRHYASNFGCTRAPRTDTGGHAGSGAPEKPIRADHPSTQHSGIVVRVEDRLHNGEDGGLQSHLRGRGRVNHCILGQFHPHKPEPSRMRECPSCIRRPSPPPPPPPPLALSLYLSRSLFLFFSFPWREAPAAQALLGVCVAERVERERVVRTLALRPRESERGGGGARSKVPTANPHRR
jgi:hypothetical protein